MKPLVAPAPSVAAQPSFDYTQSLESLVGVMQELLSLRNRSRIAEIVSRGARRITGSEGATFVLRDRDQCFYADEDAIAPLWKGARFPMRSCISGWVMMNRAPVVIEDIFADPRIPMQEYRPTFVRSLAMVPIRADDPVGAIGSYWDHTYRVLPLQVRVLQMLAEAAATALEQANS